MNCDYCNKPAVVHETTVSHGVPKEVHLCEEHAAELGIVPGGQPSVNQLLTPFVIAAKSQVAVPTQTPRKTCPSCRLTFSQLRSKGLVGCPMCYRTFERHLTALAERAQNGGAHHVGKAPHRSGVAIDQQIRIQQLLRELEDAVAAEQYERAANLRDRINSLKEGSIPRRSAAAEEGG